MPNMRTVMAAGAPFLTAHGGKWKLKSRYLFCGPLLRLDCSQGTSYSCLSKQRCDASSTLAILAPVLWGGVLQLWPFQQKRRCSLRPRLVQVCFYCYAEAQLTAGDLQHVLMPRGGVLL